MQQEHEPRLDVEVKRRRRPARAVIAEAVKTVLLAAVIFLGARTVILPYEVEGSSMVPNLHDHERVLVNQTVYYHLDLDRLLDLLPGEDHDGEHLFYPFHPPERGDIVVLDPPVPSEQPYIKRVIGLPGEAIAIRNGEVYIDGVLLDEPYVRGVRTECLSTSHCTLDPLPDGYVFVLGDNRGDSTDSRTFGPVAIERIIGKAWFSNWPMDDFGPLPSYDY